RAVGGSTPSGPISVDEAAGAAVLDALARVPEPAAGADSPLLTRISLAGDPSLAPKAGEGGRAASVPGASHRPGTRTQRPIAATAPDAGMAPQEAAPPEPPPAVAAPGAEDNAFDDIPKT